MEKLGPGDQDKGRYYTRNRKKRETGNIRMSSLQKVTEHSIEDLKSS
jgi:hypothetical protein